MQGYGFQTTGISLFEIIKLNLKIRQRESQEVALWVIWQLFRILAATVVALRNFVWGPKPDQCSRSLELLPSPDHINGLLCMVQ